MKYGICTNFKVNEGKIQIDHLDFFKKFNFDYYEINLGTIAELSDEEFETFLAFIKENEMTVHAHCGFLPASIRVTGTKTDDEAFVAFAEKAVSRAKVLGSEKIVFGCGGARNLEPGFDKEVAEKQLEKYLVMSAEIAQKHGYKIMFEHLNNMESDVFTKFEETASLTRKLNIENLKCVLDFYHFNVGNENIELVKEYADQIGHVHYAFPLRRCIPSPLWIDKICKDFQYLKDVNYNDSFSIECSPMTLNSESEDFIETFNKIKEFFEK